MRDIFLSKIETKIDDIRNLLHENLISQLMNSNDYYVNLRLTRFISSCFEMRAYSSKDNLWSISEIVDEERMASHGFRSWRISPPF